MTENKGKETLASAASTGSVPRAGFARTPDVLRYDGPQMEDYPDWESWYLARSQWVFERMNGLGKAPNAAHEQPPIQ